METIAKARPGRVYAFGDGPKTGEEMACRIAGETIREKIGKITDLRISQAPVNLGLRRRVETALDEVFLHEESAVILEDDCVPADDFFPFMSQMLERWRNHPQVGAITGTSFYDKRIPDSGSDYYFSRYPHCWGWGTWSRAWKFYDRAGRLWPTDLQKLSLPLKKNLEGKYWERIFERTYSGQIDSWAYRWTLSCWSQGMLTVTPKVNLVQNVGTGVGATHTQDATGMEEIQETGTLPKILRHPEGIQWNESADQQTFRKHHAMGAKLPFWARLLRSMRKRGVLN